MTKNTFNCFEINDFKPDEFRQFIDADTLKRFENIEFDEIITFAQRDVKISDKATQSFTTKKRPKESSQIFLSVAEYFYCLHYKADPGFNLRLLQQNVFLDKSATTNMIRNFYSNEKMFNQFNKQFHEKSFSNNNGFSNDDSNYFDNIKNIFNITALEESARAVNMNLQDYASLHLHMIWPHDGSASSKSNSVNGNTSRKYLDYNFVDINGLTSGKKLFEIDKKHPDLMCVKSDLSAIEKIQAIFILMLLRKNKLFVSNYETALKANEIFLSNENNIDLKKEPNLYVANNIDQFEDYCNKNNIDFSRFSFNQVKKGLTNKIYYNTVTGIAEKREILKFEDGINFTKEELVTDINKILNEMLNVIFENKKRIHEYNQKERKEKKSKSIYHKEWINKVNRMFPSDIDFIKEKMEFFENHYETSNYPTIIEKLFFEVFDLRTDMTASEQDIIVDQIVISRTDIMFQKDSIDRACDVKAFPTISRTKNRNDVLKMQEYLFACNKLNGYNNKTWGFFALMDNKWNFNEKDFFKTGCRDELRSFKLNFHFIELITAVYELKKNNDDTLIKTFSDKVFKYFEDSNLFN